MSYAGEVETANEQGTIEIQLSVSCADTSHQAAGLAQQSDQSAFESNPVASKEDASSTTEAKNECADEQSVFGSTPQKFAEAAKAADSMPNEQLVFRESIEAIPNIAQMTASSDESRQV